MSTDSRPIGIFDSGIGGATVLRELWALLPAEQLLYIADQAYCPYGPRPPHEIRARARAVTRMLIARGVKAVVVACNTASAAALASLREEFLQTPFIGMVPAVKPAVLRTRSGVVGVLATSATVSGAPLREVVERWAPGVRVLAQPCPGLVDLVERGELNTPETLALLARYVRPLLQAGADTLVLGCTHYPFLVDQLRALIGPHVELLDPAPAIARQTERVLTERGLLHQRSGAGHVRYGTTGDPAALAALVQRLGLPAGAVEAVESWPAEAGD